MPKLENLLNNVVSLQTRLQKAEAKVAESNKISKEELNQALTGTINNALSDRVSGQLERQSNELRRDITELSQALAGVVNDLVKIVSQFHAATNNAIVTQSEGHANAIESLLSRIEKIPDLTEIITSIANDVKAIPREQIVPKDVDLFPLMEMISSLPKPINVSDDLSDIKNRLNSGREIVYDIDYDEELDRYKRIVAREVIN